ncbi:MAG: lamin tail domain-containing protein, partial [Tannerella sp.]|nr:lamin tail domain-containing protein [Tannerella sp.]
MKRLVFVIGILTGTAALSARTSQTNAGEVYISEVMAKPGGLTAFPETEYVEIHNASNEAVALGGWAFVYDRTTIALPDTVLPPGAYAVLFRTGRDIMVDDNGTAVPLANFPNALADDGKTLRIISPEGTAVDEVAYTRATAARSWERDEAGEWYLSNDPRGGTPGAANSPATPPPPPDDPSQPGDVIFSEVMANPTGLTGLAETE